MDRHNGWTSAETAGNLLQKLCPMHSFLKYLCCVMLLNALCMVLHADVDRAASSGQLTPSENMDRESVYSKIEVLSEILMHVMRSYVDDTNAAAVVDGAIHGMLRSLDHHSDYLNEAASRDLKEDTEGVYGGIGVHIGVRNDVLTIIAPVEDSPAFKAGVMSGDRVIYIDGIKTAGMDMGRAVDLIRGKRGTKVVLSVSRDGEKEPLDIEVVRDNIDVISVKGVGIVRSGVGYIRVVQFSMPTAGLVREALEHLSAKGMEALVLDLRNNPGGLVKSAVDIAGMFLEEGQLVVTTRGRRNNGRESRQLAGGGFRLTELPVVVLVNGGSASASEILAGALQDHGRAVLLGETTYGKGSVQSIIPIKSEEGSSIRLTTARYYTPAGRTIHEHGIEPDILSYVPAAEWYAVQRKRVQMESPAFLEGNGTNSYELIRDRQMDRAVDLLEGLAAMKKMSKNGGGH